jgi:GTP diphosphokinase / guanosine-3',5'-bis(diphosphate) 3'-diphosphatase
VAASWHQGQTRKSGDPSITHPLAVATILAGTGADDAVLCAALLHDTVEDTPYTLAALTHDFGADIAALVAGTVALDQIKGTGQGTAAEVLAAVAAADSRVLAIKVADRLHNMRTVEYIAKAKQLRKARESLDIFAPAAARLSLGMIEAELQTLAHATKSATGKPARHRAACSSRWPRCFPGPPASGGARNGSANCTR